MPIVIGMPNNFALIKGKILMKFYAILNIERTTRGFSRYQLADQQSNSWEFFIQLEESVPL